jgi:hypothetical protein
MAELALPTAARLACMPYDRSDLAFHFACRHMPCMMPAAQTDHAAPGLYLWQMIGKQTKLRAPSKQVCHKQQANHKTTAKAPVNSSSQADRAGPGRHHVVPCWRAARSALAGHTSQPSARYCQPTPSAKCTPPFTCSLFVSRRNSAQGTATQLKVPGGVAGCHQPWSTEPDDSQEDPVVATQPGLHDHPPGMAALDNQQALLLHASLGR